MVEILEESEEDAVLEKDKEGGSEESLEKAVEESWTSTFKLSVTWSCLCGTTG